MADDAGSLLLRAGLVRDDQLVAARESAQMRGGTVPEELVLAGVIDDEELTAFYRSRLLVPRVAPSELAKLSRSVLDRLPADMASEFRSVPVALDREGNLTVAMSDPSDTHAVDEIGFFTRAYVVRAVATQAQIAWCLAHYYGHETELYAELVRRGRWPEVSARAGRPSSSAPVEPEPEPASPSPAIELVAEEPEVPRARGAHGRRPPPDTDETQPLPVRRPETQRPPQKPSPPELFSRSGVIEVVQPPDRGVDTGPNIVVSLQDDIAPKPVELGTESSPILLSRPKTGELDATPEAIADEVILLHHKKRPARPTRVGLGEMGTGDSARQRGEDSVPPAVGDFDGDTNESRVPELATQSRSGDAVDAGWDSGNEGLGPAISDEDVGEAIPDLVNEPETAPMRAVSAEPTIRSARLPTARQVALEVAANQLLVALRAIEKAPDRDAVVQAMLDYLHLSFEHCHFFAQRGTSLQPFRIGNEKASEPDQDLAPKLDLSIDSTFRDVMRMRLPFRGPLDDLVSNNFAAATLGSQAGDSLGTVLLLPLTVRERVVGVLFGASEKDELLEEHIAVLLRAASDALEEIVKARKRLESTSD